jgi:hypothetical protein
MAFDARKHYYSTAGLARLAQPRGFPVGDDSNGMKSRLRETNAHPLRQRLLRTLRRLKGAAGVKTHEVHFVRVDGTLLKRIRFEKDGDAVAVESALVDFGSSAGLPAVVRRDGRELWLEYVEGPGLDPGRHDGALLVTEFYATLYAGAVQTLRVDASPYPERLKDDLRWLVSSRVIAASAASAIARRAAAVEPRQVLLGFDFIDPVPKNFVIRGKRLVGVDVEAFRPNTLLGTGPAKALFRWLDMSGDEMTRRLRDCGTPDLSSQFEYAELCFRCSYARQKHLQRKAHLAPPSIFDPYLGDVADVRPRSLVAQSAS